MSRTHTDDNPLWARHKHTLTQTHACAHVQINTPTASIGIITLDSLSSSDLFHRRHTSATVLFVSLPHLTLGIPSTAHTRDLMGTYDQACANEIPSNDTDCVRLTLPHVSRRPVGASAWISLSKSCVLPFIHFLCLLNPFQGHQ